MKYLRPGRSQQSWPHLSAGFLAGPSEPEGSKLTSINNAQPNFSCSHRIEGMKKVRIKK